MTLCGELFGDRFIRETFRGEFDNQIFHFSRGGEEGKRSDLNWDQQRGGFATGPDDACLYMIAGDPVQGDLLNQATQERFLLLSREQVLVPNLGQFLSDGCERRLELGGEGEGHHDKVFGLYRCFFSVLELAQGRFPAGLQFCGDESIIRVDAVELALSECRLVTQSLDLLLTCLVSLISTVLVRCQSACINIELDR